MFVSLPRGKAALRRRIDVTFERRAGALLRPHPKGNPLRDELLEARVFADGVEVLVAAGVFPRPLLELDGAAQVLEGVVGVSGSGLEARGVVERQHVVRL